MTKIEAVDFYWRQGCGFCMALDRGLGQAGIPIDKKNIWDDPRNAEFVRSVANGNETVPTISVGTTTMVNPTVAQVIEALKTAAPHLLPEGYTEPTKGPIGRVADRILGKE